VPSMGKPILAGAVYDLPGSFQISRKMSQNETPALLDVLPGAGVFGAYA